MPYAVELKAAGVAPILGLDSSPSCLKPQKLVDGRVDVDQAITTLVVPLAGEGIGERAAAGVTRAVGRSLLHPRVGRRGLSNH